jgi:hypothetical protein
MKTVAKLELDRDFDKKLKERIQIIRTTKNGTEAAKAADQELITEVRRLVKQAFVLGGKA